MREGLMGSILASFVLSCSCLVAQITEADGWRLETLSLIHI